MAERHLVAHVPGEVDETFRKYDTDKSNSLDSAELKHVMQDLREQAGNQDPVTDEEVKYVIGVADEKGDGKIDRLEIMKLTYAVAAWSYTILSYPILSYTILYYTILPVLLRALWAFSRGREGEQRR